MLLAVAAALGRVGRVVAGQGYSSEAWRKAMRRRGAQPVVLSHPSHRNAPGHDVAACAGGGTGSGACGRG